MKNIAKIVIILLVVIPLMGCTPFTNGSTVETVEMPVSGAPLYQMVTLWSDSVTESDEKPNYTITASIPQLQGSTDGWVMNFNSQMVTLVYEEVDAFKENLTMLPAESITGGSSLQINYEPMAPEGNLLSLKLTISYYSDGAAHPGSYSRTATYDLEAGQFVTLEQLFLPGSDYLGAISAYCLSQLQASEIGPALFTEGALLTAENYRNWNITADGLLITFDEYQVAAYAAGPQQVVVPYSELGSIIDPQGPIG